MIWKTKIKRCIYQSATGIHVYQNGYYRWLTLGSNALQTLIHRKHPEKPGLNYIRQLSFLVLQQPADCCILGLGGGGMAHVLTNQIGTSQIIAVENNLEVIDVARNYFMIDQIKNLTIIHQDANLFIQQANTSWRHLIIDLFDAESFPNHCMNTRFFTNCRKLLVPGGILAVNLANVHEQWPVFELIRTAFNSCTVALPVKNTPNMVILAYNDESINPLLTLLKQSNQLKKLSWDSKWGCIAHI